MPVFRCQLCERAAYKALFVFGGGLATLNPAEVRNIESAMVNAQALMREAIGFLASSETSEAEEAA